MYPPSDVCCTKLAPASHPDEPVAEHPICRSHWVFPLESSFTTQAYPMPFELLELPVTMYPPSDAGSMSEAPPVEAPENVFCRWRFPLESVLTTHEQEAEQGVPKFACVARLPAKIYPPSDVWRTAVALSVSVPVFFRLVP